MDFITGLPLSRHLGRVYNTILVVIDHYTKVSRYIPYLKTTSSEELADLFVQNWTKDFGVPAGIVMDRGRVFTSAVRKSFCYRLSIKRRLSTVFHL